MNQCAMSWTAGTSTHDLLLPVVSIKRSCNSELLPTEPCCYVFAIIVMCAVSHADADTN